MIEPKHPKVSISRQCRLLKFPRSSFYFQPKVTSKEDLELMRQIDAQYMETPFFGSRRMREHLRRLGHRIGRGKVRRLMRKMGISAIYQKPKTTIANKDHKKYPYLLRHLKITRPNQVWCTDITYLPVQRGFFYLVAIMGEPDKENGDGAPFSRRTHSRKVLAWRLSNTLDTGFCVEALREAMEKYGRPEIFNTDQGCQFTSSDWCDVLLEAGVKISMDGKGRWMDNVFVERLWRSVKYECLFLHDWAPGSQVRAGLKDWFALYNARRPHQALGYRTPDEVYAGKGTPEPGKPVDMMDNAAALPTYPQDKNSSIDNIVVLQEAA